MSATKACRKQEEETRSTIFSFFSPLHPSYVSYLFSLSLIVSFVLHFSISFFPFLLVGEGDVLAGSISAIRVMFIACYSTLELRIARTRRRRDVRQHEARRRGKRDEPDFHHSDSGAG